MRIIFGRPLLLASAAALSASPLIAGPPLDEAPSASLAAWVTAVNAQVEQAVAEPYEARGFVVASFRRGEDGRATDIRVNGVSSEIRSAARTTLRRIGRLPPLPEGFDPHQRIKLQLLLDEADVQTYQAKREALLASAETANRRVLDGMPAIRTASTNHH